MAAKVRLDANPSAAPGARTVGQQNRSLQMRFSERRLLLMAGDIAATVAAVVVGLYLWAMQAHKPFTSEFILPHVHWFIILPALWFGLASTNDYYNLRISARRQTSLLRLAFITAQLLVIYLFIFFLSPRDSLPRSFIVYYAVCSLALTGAWRTLWLFLIGRSRFRRRAAIVGGGRTAEVIWAAVQEEAKADYEVVGCIASTQDRASLTRSLRILGEGPELPVIVREHGVTELIVAYVNDIPNDIFVGVMACYEQGVDLTPMTTLYEEITGRIPIEHVGEQLWALVLPVQGRAAGFRLYLIAKRLMDILFALVGLLAFAVLAPLLALAIKVDSPGPVFYIQPRLGKGGRVFPVVKLRSMQQDAERTSGPVWAQPGDARITRVGKFLRKTRLDEVPQLINVLRGEMSIVGPRPERPEMAAMLAEKVSYYRTRLAVKPGLTGWAQVRYRYGCNIDDAVRKLQYDLYYIRYQSIRLDVTIMARTIGTILLFRGT